MKKHIYIFASVLTSIVFLSGILFGFLINVQTSEMLKEEFKDFAREIEAENINLVLYDMSVINETCDKSSHMIKDIIDKTSETGKKLEIFEESKKIDLPTYKNLKKDYTLLQTKYYLFAKKLKSRCNYNYSIVLYFYGPNCEKCRDQGIILTALKRKYEEDLLIFSFDCGLDISTISAFKNIYRIENFPTLIVNDKKYGFLSINELEKILLKDESYNLTSDIAKD